MLQKAETDQKNALMVNDTGVEYLAKICGVKNIPLIHISTDFIFDSPIKVCSFFEDDTPNPTSIYGKSKLSGEQKIQLHSKKFIIIRSSWVISNTHSKNFFKTVL